MQGRPKTKMTDLSKFLREMKTDNGLSAAERRAHERFSFQLPGCQLSYKGTNIPCEVIDISLGGCRVRTTTRFNAGALANVELLMQLQGQKVQVYGMTQWTSQGNQVGIRFIHPSFRSKVQMEALIAGLFDQRAAEAIEEAVIGANAPSVGENSVKLDAKLIPGTSPAFIQSVHGSESRARSWEDGEWPVEIRYLSDRLQLKGSIFDLSLQGCSVRTIRPFAGEFHVPVEVAFRLMGLPFLLAATPTAIDDPCTVGIVFSQMSFRRRDELGQLIEELRELGKAKFPERAAELENEPFAGAASVSEAETETDSEPGSAIEIEPVVVPDPSQKDIFDDGPSVLEDDKWDDQEDDWIKPKTDNWDD